MTESKFAQHVETMRSRYDQVLASAGFDAAVIYSGGLRMQFLDDAAYPFKVNPLFKAWVPLTEHPDCFVVHVPGDRPKLLYYQPDDYWHRPPDDPRGFWTSSFDVIVFTDLDDARQHMPEGRIAFLGEWQERYDEWGFASANPETVLNGLHYRRAWKTEYEIDCMEEATRLGVLGHRAARLSFYDGATEYEIHLAYCQACHHTDDTLPYSNIIALNNHGAILHYTFRDTVGPKERLSFLIDAGASFQGYASDITRTYSSNGGLFASLIESVDAMQQSLCSALKPGVSYVDLHIEAHRSIARILVDAGLITVSSDEAVETGLSGLFFPHGLGHYIGLQVHDVGGFMRNADGDLMAPPDAHPFLRLTRSVDTGQVMTVEPGLYFIGSLLEPERSGKRSQALNWNLIDELYPYGGIRIEDNVLITADGARNLTREAFAAA